MTAAVASPKPRGRVRTDGVITRMPALKPAPSSAFMRGEKMPVFFNWHPSLREANDDVKTAWRLATSRSIDSIQNNGWLAGAVDHSVASVVGSDLRLNAKPNAEALGWTQDQANAWARKTEARFSMWADNPRACDAGARFRFGQLCAQAYRHWMPTGEILATLPFNRREGSQWGTKIRLLPAWRMCNRSAEPDLISGVRIDRSSAPRSYLLNIKNDIGGYYEREVPARDNYGRPLVVHIFDGEPDQVRGISQFTPILKVTKQFDQLADATLTAAIAQAVLVAMFKTPAPDAEALAAMLGPGDRAVATDNGVDLKTLVSCKADWYKETDVNLNIGGKIIHGFPGDEMQFFRNETPNTTYEPFTRFLLRECSRVLAMTYEEFSGDYSSATFSLIKFGTAVNWPRVLFRRKHIVGPFAQAAYEAWLEEDIEIGGTEFPGGVDGFLVNREAAAQANWIGPARPQPDDLKAAESAAEWQKVGVPDGIVFGELGLDVDDVYEQLKREKDRRAALGITRVVDQQPSAAGSKPGQPPQDDKQPAQGTAQGGS